MSTKTTFKRIALGLVATLGFGLLSALPSYAAEATPTALVAGKTTEDDGVALAASKYTASTLLNAGGISAFSVVAASLVELAVIPVGGASQAGAKTRLAYAGVGIFHTSAAMAGSAAGTAELLDAFTAPSTAGTYTINAIYDEDADFTTTDDQRTFTVAMTITNPAAVSGSLSTAFITAGNAGTAATVDTNAVTASGSSTMAAANRGSILLTMKDTAAAAMATGNLITAQITSGPGYLVALTADTPTVDQCSTTPTYSATVGRAISAFNPGAIANIIICADGIAGVASISLSVTNQLVTTAWATKSFTFYGAVRTLSVATSNFTVGAAGGDETGAADASRDATGEVTNAGALTASTSTPAFIIAAKDSASQLATASAAPVVISSNVAVVASGLCILDDGATVYSSGEGFGLYNCSFTTAATAKSGDTATLTFRIADPLGTAGIDYLTTTAVVTVGGARYKETISLDKATYNPGEAMVITRTATDASGNVVADGSSAPAVIFNKAVGGTAPAAGFYVGGKLVTSATKPGVFAPVASGVFEARITGYNSSATATTPIIATAVIAESSTELAAQAAADAAAEATDAANAATDAANAAAEAADAATAAAQDAADAVAALSTQVAEMVAALKKQITALTNLVIKIQKKVKA